MPLFNVLEGDLVSSKVIVSHLSFLIQLVNVGSRIIFLIGATYLLKQVIHDFIVAEVTDKRLHIISDDSDLLTMKISVD